MEITNKIEDGVVLFYAKDGEIYPVALSEHQVRVLPMVMNLLGTLKIIKDKPQGQAVNLLEGKS